MSLSKESLEVCGGKKNVLQELLGAVDLLLSSIGENRQLVTDEPVEVTGNYRVKFKTAGILPVILEEFIEYTPN